MANSPKSEGISSEILLSIATVPLLGGLLAGRAIAELIKTIGQTSEEIFRGDRLPALRITDGTDEQGS